jgi:transcriptional regulator with XRE-family HTH domain
MTVSATHLSLRELRERADLTQQELAYATGINVLTISRAELGKQRPRRANLQRLADVLGVPLSELEQAIAG